MQDPAERESKVKESVEKAKEAVAMDVKDGISWSTSNVLPIIYINIDSSPSSPPSLFCPFLSPSFCHYTVILGNAYLSLFFSSQQDSKILKQCVSAYSQAVCLCCH